MLKINVFVGYSIKNEIEAYYCLTLRHSKSSLQLPVEKIISNKIDEKYIKIKAIENLITNLKKQQEQFKIVYFVNNFEIYDDWQKITKDSTIKNDLSYLHQLVIDSNINLEITHPNDSLSSLSTEEKYD